MQWAIRPGIGFAAVIPSSSKNSNGSTGLKSLIDNNLLFILKLLSLTEHPRPLCKLVALKVSWVTPVPSFSASGLTAHFDF